MTSLIEAAGGMPDDTGKVVNGGPMMGKALAMTDVPVTKGTSGIILFPADESRRGEVSAMHQVRQVLDRHVLWALSRGSSPSFRESHVGEG